VVLRHPNPSDVSELDDKIAAFNYDATNARDFIELGIFVRGNGDLLAGLYGDTWGGCLRIRFLWVSEHLRRRGHGARLLECAEREAVRRGCGLVTLETHDFQEFYRRCGCEEFGTLHGYPVGHAKYYFKKHLIDSN
jgi:GNAT superfamily N-acetyltransferase